MSEAPDMSASDSPLTAALAVLVDLSRRARQARSEAELAFLLVNDTHSLVPYRQAALWRADRGLQALSGLVQPEANAPYAQWLKAMVAHLMELKLLEEIPEALEEVEEVSSRTQPKTTSDCVINAYDK